MKKNYTEQNITIIQKFFAKCKGKSFKLSNGRVVDFDKMRLRVVDRPASLGKRTALGLCSFNAIIGNTISFAKKVFELCDKKESMIDLCVHELGHAVCNEAGSFCGHGKLWEETTAVIYKTILGKVKTCKATSNPLEETWVYGNPYLYYAKKNGEKLVHVPSFTQEVFESVINGLKSFINEDGARVQDVKLVNKFGQTLFQYQKVEEIPFKLVRENLATGEKTTLKECKTEEEAIVEFNNNFDFHVENFVKTAISNKQNLDPDKLLESYRKINKAVVISLENPLGESIESFVPVKTCYKRHIVEALTELNPDVESSSKKDTKKDK